MTDEFDFVVAGAGSAGCALAARLAASGEHSVCLVEAGGARASLWSHMPAGNGFLFGNSRYDWAYSSAPQAALNGRSIYYPRGRGVGGSSLLNGMIYIRGTAGDYDRWRDLGLPGWSYAELLPYFRRSASAPHRAGDPCHGDGPLRLSPAGNFDEINQRFVDACVAAGAPRNPDFNGAIQRGVGRLDTTVWNGRRQSAAVAYLTPKPRKLALKTDTLVHRVLFEGRRAVGLQTSSGVLRARREVILSLGAFGTPQTLMLSGVGPGAHLADKGVDLVCDLPGVGASLYDHPQYPMKLALRDEGLSLARWQRIDRAALLALNYAVRGKGPGAAPFWSSQLFHALRDPANPELQVYLTPMCVTEEPSQTRLSLKSLMNVGTVFLSRGKQAVPGLQFDVVLLHPASSGTVRLASIDPAEPPVIDPNWFSDTRDMSDLIAGIRYLRKVAEQRPLAEVLDAEMQPGPSRATDEALAASIREHVTTGHHPVATCRMGPEQDSGAVLDAALQVRGVARLRVVDASAFPAQIGGNPNAPVMMLAEKAADLILGRSPPTPDDLADTHSAQQLGETGGPNGARTSANV